MKGLTPEAYQAMMFLLIGEFMGIMSKPVPFAEKEKLMVDLYQRIAKLYARSKRSGL